VGVDSFSGPHSCYGFPENKQARGQREQRMARMIEECCLPLQDERARRREGQGQEREQVGQCMPIFNPTSREGYESTVSSWVGTLLVLADHLALFPHAGRGSHEAHQDQQPKPTTAPWKQELAE